VLSVAVGIALATAGLLLLARRGPWQASLIALGAGTAHRLGFILVPALVGLTARSPTPVLGAIRRASAATALSATLPEVICLMALAWFIATTAAKHRVAQPRTRLVRNPQDPVIVLSVVMLWAYHGADMLLLPGRFSTFSRSLLHGASAPANIAVLIVGSIAALATIALAIALLARARGTGWLSILVLGISMLYVLATQMLARGTWAPALGSVGPWAVTSLLERCVLIVALIGQQTDVEDEVEES
jgi:hypothetical protein